MKIAVLDMQPIDPPTGGGRLRLLGLYHALGTGLNARYVGTYDWPGPGFRRQMLSSGLEEVLVPLSDEHFAAAAARSRAAGGRNVIDSTFPDLACLSPDYVAAARDAAAAADVVIFSHPWIFPLVRGALDTARQLIVYDAHNVEGLLRMELLDDGGAGTDVVRGVIEVEFELCLLAHLILACSHEDRCAFNRLYGVPNERIRVVPNGAFTDRLCPSTARQKEDARRVLGVGPGPVAFFIGSNYGPNVEAARYIANTLARELPHITFAIVGGVGESLAHFACGTNLRTTGLLSDEQKRSWLWASDVGINPMFEGSGTNVKMFDFMAAGLPIVTTPVGARGITADVEAFVVADREEFAAAIRRILDEPALSAALGHTGREYALSAHSWQRISGMTGALLARRAATARRPLPFFSVIVPTYERHRSLTHLVECLAQQSWHDFELIVVDQSTHEWPDRARSFGLDLIYTRTDVRGAVRARNAGADLARGQVLAFVDDDCEPERDWLMAARDELASGDIVGLEGLIVSDHARDPEWRPVTNEGFEGIAFMTANLFLRAETFHAIGGFDVAFDNPHFREDTDLGWRAQERGAIPFSRRARVFHPAQPRALERKSLQARSRFFEKDALLLRKHPMRYVELLRREAQWSHNPYFWSQFLAGTRRYGVTVPDEILAMMPDEVRGKPVLSAPPPTPTALRDRSRAAGSC